MKYELAHLRTHAASACARARRWALAAGLLLAAAMAHAVAPPAGATLQVQASAVYTGFSGLQEKAYSNSAMVQIAAVEALTLQGDSWLARAPGTRTTLAYRIANLGNTDSKIRLTVANTNTCSGYSDTTDLSALRVVVDAIRFADHVFWMGAIELSQGLVAQQKVTLRILEQDDVRAFIDGQPQELILSFQGFQAGMQVFRKRQRGMRHISRSCTNNDRNY